MPAQAKTRTCLWFEKDGHKAAAFYSSLIPGSALPGLIGHADTAAATRATEAMLKMRKIDIAAIEAAFHGA